MGRLLAIRRALVSIGLNTSSQRSIPSPHRVTTLPVHLRSSHTFTCSFSWSDSCVMPGLKSSSSSSSSPKSSFKKLRDMFTAGYRQGKERYRFDLLSKPFSNQMRLFFFFRGVSSSREIKAHTYVATGQIVGSFRPETRTVNRKERGRQVDSSTLNQVNTKPRSYTRLIHCTTAAAAASSLYSANNP